MFRAYDGVSKTEQKKGMTPAKPQPSGKNAKHNRKKNCQMEKESNHILHQKNAIKKKKCCFLAQQQQEPPTLLQTEEAWIHHCPPHFLPLYPIAGGLQLAPVHAGQLAYPQMHNFGLEEEVEAQGSDGNMHMAHRKASGIQTQNLFDVRGWC